MLQNQFFTKGVEMFREHVFLLYSYLERLASAKIERRRKEEIIFFFSITTNLHPTTFTYLYKEIYKEKRPKIARLVQIESKT